MGHRRTSGKTVPERNNPSVLAVSAGMPGSIEVSEGNIRISVTRLENGREAPVASLDSVAWMLTGVTPDPSARSPRPKWVPTGWVYGPVGYALKGGACLGPEWVKWVEVLDGVVSVSRDGESEWSHWIPCRVVAACLDDVRS